jgi:hypothetical protein
MITIAALVICPRRLRRQKLKIAALVGALGVRKREPDCKTPNPGLKIEFLW